MDSKHVYLTDHKGPICDFCGKPDPVWAFDGPDPMAGRHGNLYIQDNGSWASCEECSEFVEAQNVQALVARCRSFVGELPSDILTITLTIYFSKVVKTLGRRRKPNARELGSKGGMTMTDAPHD